MAGRKLVAEFSCRIKSIQPLTDSVSQLLVQAENSALPAYEAGQYMNVLHDDQSISPLSIAGAPRADNLMEFHLAHPAHNLPALDLLRQAREKKIWRMEGPFGKCTADRLRADRPVILVARGTGFAPVKAVIEAMMRLPVYPPLSFYWSAARRADFYMVNLLTQWSRQVPDFAYTLVDQDTETARPAMLIQKILQDHPDFSHKQVYASGSSQFIYAVFPELHFRGLQTEFFFSDVF